GSLFIVGLIPSQPGIGCIGVVRSPSVFVLFLYGAAEEEGHNSLPVEIAISFTNSLYKDRNINTLVICIEPSSISVSGNGASDNGLIPIVDDPVVVEVPVLDIARPHVAKLRGVVIYFLLRLKQAVGHIAKKGTYGRTFAVDGSSCVLNALHVNDIVLHIRKVDHHAVVNLAHPIPVIDHQVITPVFNRASILIR